jgi:predicted PurR-regulated permease PerM
MQIFEKGQTFEMVLRIGVIAAMVWGCIWLLGYLSEVLIPFAVAVLLAYLINPLVVEVQAKIHNRFLSVMLSLLLIFSVLLAVITVVTPLISQEVSAMGKILDEFYNNSEIAQRAQERLPPDVLEAMREYTQRPDVQEFFDTENFRTLVISAARRLVPGVWGVITGTTGIILGLLGVTFIILYLIFILLDYRRLNQGWKDLLPAEYREHVVEFVKEFDTQMSRYFRGQAVVAGTVGVLFAIGFYMISLPMGILFGLFVGLLNMVPYLQTLGFLPAAFLALIHSLGTGESYFTVFGMVVLVFAVVQTIQDAFLVPKIMGKVTGLSPAMILLSLAIWGKLLGLFGLLIALPMTCLTLAYYQRFLSSVDNDHRIVMTEKCKDFQVE